MDEGLIRTLVERARSAAHVLASLDETVRTSAIRAAADELHAASAAVLAANDSDVAAARAAGASDALLDRLALSSDRIAGMVRAMRDIADAPSVVGAVEHATTRPNGLRVERVRIPLGVIAMVYEARPNVTSDAMALCLKAGNACILRGGSDVFATNQAIGAALVRGVLRAGLPEASVQLLPVTDRAALTELLQQDDCIDVVIPRGGESLIRFVSETSRIPVIRHYKGVCHVYVHSAADVDMARRIVVNAKTQRPTVCNAAETLLIDAAIAPTFLPLVVRDLTAAGVSLRLCEQSAALVPGHALATEADFYAEYLALILAVRIVPSMEAAIEHIATYGSNHTEAIVTNDRNAAERFLRNVQSSTVVHNASTRFADGGELGLGAEIGISTSKLHAYGPMGAEGLTTLKWVVRGDGHVRT